MVPAQGSTHCGVDLPTGGGGPWKRNTHSALMVLWCGSFAQPGRHFPFTSLPMSLISTKGILAGAVLAAAGTLAISTTPAQAAACATNATIGSLATPCDLKGFTLAINSFTDGSLGIQTSGDSDGFFGLGQIGTKPAGSFTFTVTAAPNTFFNFSDFILSGPPGQLSSVTTPFFTFDANGESFSNSDTSLTSITGTYNYDATGPLSISSVKFTTDVPVPLPVVGAGLAFGFTRNLRKRAKSVA